ncbi:replication protein A 70 kDa DNA-binding subunit-like isoform X3 [Amblyomma americanum]
MDSLLTRGAIERIFSKQQVDKPVLQILKLVPIPSPSGNRYRITLWDGLQENTRVMLGTQLSMMVDYDEIDQFAVVQLDHYVHYTAPLGDILVVLRLTVVEKGFILRHVLGNGALSSSSPDAPSTASAPSSFRNCQDPGSFSDVVPITSLTPFYHRWTIRARVTNKSSVQEYDSARGRGRRFSMSLLDESGEIRAVAFNSECDRLCNVIEDNKVYYISKASVRKVRPGYPSSIVNDYEMFFTSETTIVPCNDDTSNIPAIQFNFVPIERLQEVSKDSVVDVIGVCTWADEVRTVTVRNTNEERKKRDVRLMDQSGTEVCLTLWGDQAERFHGCDNHVVAAKEVRVTYFNGRTEVNWKSLAQAKAEGLGQDGPDYYNVKAYVSVISKNNALYRACPRESCYKKVTELENGHFRCEKCNRQTTDFKWRPLISVTLADFSGEQSVTCFGKEGEQLIGKSAAELGEMYTVSGNEDTRFEDALFDVLFRPFIFRLRAKKEFYNGEIILRTSAIDVTPVNYVEYTQRLLGDIAELSKNLRERPPRE